MLRAQSLNTRKRNSLSCEYRNERRLARGQQLAEAQKLASCVGAPYVSGRASTLAAREPRTRRYNRTYARVAESDQGY